MARWLKCTGIVLAALIGVGWAISGLSTHLAAQQVPPPPPPDADTPPALNAPGTPAPAAADQSGGEVLTRGPLHEAFAEVVAYNPQPGQIVAKKPPEAIEEVPPAQKPAGGEFTWIPGYWAWDNDRSDYIWISGVWRAPAPGMTWVPGYWGQVANGYQWTSGYWGPATSTTTGRVETQYLPAPPQTLESGASSPQPSADYFWIPGCWEWQDRWVWRAGHWGPMHTDWVWIPAHYIWTPGGYVFVDGHWDYTMERRGLAFCPVYYATPVYAQPGYYYSPAVCIDTPVLTGCLFCRPAYCHYYFGDYYDASYVRIGIYPWFSPAFVRIGYDPCFVYARWHYGRGDPMWESHMREQYAFRVAHVEARPPRTYAAMQIAAPGVRINIGVPLTRMAASGGGGFRYEAVSAAHREEYRKLDSQVRQVQAERRTQEVNARAQAGPGGLTRPVRMNMPTATLATSHQVTNTGGNAGGRNVGAGTTNPGGRVATPYGAAPARGAAPATTTRSTRDTSKDRSKDRNER
jgi:hypothetical protein